ncbi:CRISPR-associated CARF protein Csx1 [Anaerobranca gottschalkii]|uniref:CRISPR-associated protein Csx1 n=1 Tax=Anaerobranca gottschalkii DSM 13577 TaxID=1120990 RepID=A0A1I0AAS3_9FIRM|nr:CRISPR-associated CARF protein Csx1 [Anaerobranca gottschalkii]SES90781.1 CRISPR-associated protein Csx1 [Anaerobranca gottschalkii DSM 13577]
MNVIYQIARMEDSKKIFCISFEEGDCEREKFEKESSLSSFVVRDYFKDSKQENSEAVIFYPVSIVLNERLLKNLKTNVKYSNNTELINKLENVFEKPTEYLKNPKDVIKLFPFEEEKDDYLVLSSFGTYLNNIEVKGSYSDIVLTILADMVTRYLHKDVTSFYIDISSGYNFYISALLEAARHFSVFATLYNWDNKEKIPKVYTVFTDPILGNNVSKYNVYVEQQHYLAFFNSPVNKEDVCQNDLKFIKDSIYTKKELRKNKNSLRTKLLKFSFLYSAIKNNLPLYIIDSFLECHKEEEIKEEIIDLMKFIIIEIENKGYECSPNLNKSAFVKSLLSLALYRGILTSLKNTFEKINIANFKADGVDMEVIRNVFEEVYINFNMESNYKLLSSEINNLLKNKSKIDDNNQWVPLWKIIGEKSEGEIDQRNFFAHCGMERNVVDLKKSTDKIWIKYNNYFSSRKGNIENWIKEKI